MTIPVRISDHARKQMQRRRISRNQVERTISNPDTLTLGQRGRLCAKGLTQSGRTIVVVYAEEMTGTGPSYFVVTTWRE